MDTTTALLGIGAAGFAGLWVHDRYQRRRAVLRNYPVFGRFRFVAEWSGEFLRQYLYLPNWSERPFNRLQRSWVYRSAKRVSNYVSFGSETNPDFVFRPAAFPALDEETRAWPGVQVGVTEGPGACRQPYVLRAFFNVSGMSRGALSAPAVLALSRGVRKAGGFMSTGEGALAPEHVEGGADVSMQIGTAKYGVRDADGNLDEARLAELAAIPTVVMFEVKLAQGAKPGKGGVLPGAKVTPEIAAIRGIPVGQDSISPNRHRDIGSVAELGAFVDRVRRVTGKPVGVKFVVGDEAFLDEWFAWCAAHPEHCPDYVQVDGGEGGTGAAPASLAEHVGLSIVHALPMVVAALERAGLRQRVRVFASGKLITPDKVAWALCMGATAVSAARGPMFAMGCIQSMKCGSGRCPTGVTASDPRFVRGLDPEDKGDRVANYLLSVRGETETIAHSCGLADASGFLPRHVTDPELGVAGFRTRE